MALTIYATHQWADLSAETLRDIIRRHTAHGKMDAQRIYDEVAKLCRWASADDNHSQVAVDTSYETCGEFVLPDHRKGGMYILNTADEVEIVTFVAPIQRRSPQDVVLEMQEFERGVRLSIEENIRDLIFRNGKNGTLKTKEDDYLGFPAVYSQNARCTINELKGATVRKNGKIGFLVGTLDKHTVPADPISVLPVSELLQAWTILAETHV